MADQEAATSDYTPQHADKNEEKKMRPNGGGLVPAGTQHPRADDKQMISHKEVLLYLDHKTRLRLSPVHGRSS